MPPTFCRSTRTRCVRSFCGTGLETPESEITGSLEKRFGRKLNVTVREDASLIGGIRVVVGDEVLDTSVKARLEQMKVALTA